MEALKGFAALVGTVATGFVMVCAFVWFTGPENPLGWQLDGANNMQYRTLDKCNEVKVIVEDAGFKVGSCLPDFEPAKLRAATMAEDAWEDIGKSIETKRRKFVRLGLIDN